MPGAAEVKLFGKWSFDGLVVNDISVRLLESPRPPLGALAAGRAAPRPAAPAPAAARPRPCRAGPALPLCSELCCAGTLPLPRVTACARASPGS